MIISLFEMIYKSLFLSDLIVILCQTPVKKNTLSHENFCIFCLTNSGMCGQCLHMQKTADIHIRIEPDEKLSLPEAAKHDGFEDVSSWVRFLIRTQIKEQNISQDYQKQKELNKIKKMI